THPLRSLSVSRSSFYCSGHHPALHSFPTRRSSDLHGAAAVLVGNPAKGRAVDDARRVARMVHVADALDLRIAADRRRVEAHRARSEEHTSELQSLTNLVCRLLLEKKKEHVQAASHD